MPSPSSSNHTMTNPDSNTSNKTGIVWDSEDEREAWNNFQHDALVLRSKYKHKGGMIFVYGILGVITAAMALITGLISLTKGLKLGKNKKGKR